MRLNRILGISLTENTLFEPRFCVFLRRIQYSKDHSLLQYCRQRINSVPWLTKEVLLKGNVIKMFKVAK